MEKGSDSTIINQNNRRLGHLKIHFMNQNSLVMMEDVTCRFWQQSIIYARADSEKFTEEFMILLLFI